MAEKFGTYELNGETREPSSEDEVNRIRYEGWRLVTPRAAKAAADPAPEKSS